MLSTSEFNQIIGIEVINPEISKDSTDVYPIDSGFTDNPLVFFEDFRERYQGIDFDYYRSAMTTEEYKAYIDFIGGERFESDFLPSDFEVYYPEDED
jgi:hypothetical protein